MAVQPLLLHLSSGFGCVFVTSTPCPGEMTAEVSGVVSQKFFLNKIQKLSGALPVSTVVITWMVKHEAPGHL